MELQGEDGIKVDASFSVEECGPYKKISFEAAGWQRNKGYDEGLELLLTRLALWSADVIEAYVDSNVARQYPPDKARLKSRDFPFPLSLKNVKEINNLRKAWQKEMKGIASKAKTGGNGQKALAIVVDSPEWTKISTLDLEALLSGCSKQALMLQSSYEEIVGLEGELKLVNHFTRERNSQVTNASKKAFRKQHGTLFCEACGFNFERLYGELGKDYIEAHHNIPLSKLEPNTETRASDFTMLCSNCHRMVHRKKDVTSVSELKKVIERSAFSGMK